MDKIAYNGWPNCVRLSNGEIEAIVTTDVGPRILRLGFTGARNVFAEIKGQQAGIGEKKWMIRGGHRFWIAPEDPARSYELDNVPVEYSATRGGVRLSQPPGPVTGVVKALEVMLDPRRNVIRVIHTLTNAGRRATELAPWALSVMAPRGRAIIPLPPKRGHTGNLLHNQEWSLWGYTDFSDPRWTFESRYVFFRQDPKRGPNKLGIAHRDGWVAYQLGEFVFIKRFAWLDGQRYPDGGVNFETFSNEDFLELESLGPLVKLAPGKSVTHEEVWSLHRGVAPVRNQDDADALIRPLVLPA